MYSNDISEIPNYTTQGTPKSFKAASPFYIACNSILNILCQILCSNLFVFILSRYFFAFNFRWSEVLPTFVKEKIYRSLDNNLLIIILKLIAFPQRDIRFSLFIKVGHAGDKHKILKETSPMIGNWIPVLRPMENGATFLFHCHYACTSIQVYTQDTHDTSYPHSHTQTNSDILLFWINFTAMKTHHCFHNLNSSW